MNARQTSDQAVAAINEALRLIHAVPLDDCVIQASWPVRLEQAESRVLAGLVDETDFDEVNRGRTAAEIFSELSWTSAGLASHTPRRTRPWPFMTGHRRAALELVRRL